MSSKWPPQYRPDTDGTQRSAGFASSATLDGGRREASRTHRAASNRLMELPRQNHASRSARPFVKLPFQNASGKRKAGNFKVRVMALHTRPAERHS